MARFRKRSRIAAPPEQVFAWHRRDDALERLVPPWARVRVTRRPAALEEGARAELTLRLGPLPVRWVAEHRDVRHLGSGGGCFTDVQVRGPFARWEHTHRILPDGHGGTLLEDDIDYALPLGRLGRLAEPLVARRLERMFTWRHRMTAAAFRP